MLFGNKNFFAIEYKKGEGYHEMSLFIDNKDILLIEVNNVVYCYRWRYFDPLIEWIEDNLKYILQFDDIFEEEVTNASQYIIECRSSDDESNEYMSYLENLGDWCWHHGWLCVRPGGSYLADVIFRRVKNTIEISWNNYDTYKNQPKFVYNDGCYYVDIKEFEKVMKDFCNYYRKINID